MIEEMEVYWTIDMHVPSRLTLLAGRQESYGNDIRSFNERLSFLVCAARESMEMVSYKNFLRVTSKSIAVQKVLTIVVINMGIE